MSKNLTINGVAYNGVSNVTIGSAIFRDADEVITTPTATKTITENGSDIDILNYSKATVNVPVGVQPSGTLVLNLSESVADRDCANYAKVTVNITKDSSAPVLSSISATYSGGTVAAGTTLDSLTGISITATYTLSGYNGTLTKSGITTGYTLSGTLTAGQTNTVNVTYGGKTATIQVPVAAEALVLDKLVVTYDNSTAVAAGTALSALNEVVKAQYTNGTQTAALTEGTDYELSGTLTAGQTNTITVTGKGTYAGLAAMTFSVTVEAEVVSATNYWISDSIAGANSGTTTFQISGLTSTDYDNIQYIDLGSEQTTKGSTPGIAVNQMRLKKESGTWTLKSVYRENSANDLSSSVTLTSVTLGSEAITITLSGLNYSPGLTYWITCYDDPSSLPTGNANQYWSQATILQNGGGSSTFAFPTRLNKGLIKQSTDFTSITIIQDSSYTSPSYSVGMKIAANKLVLTKDSAGNWTGEVTYYNYSTSSTASTTVTAEVSVETDGEFGNTLISLTATATSGVSIEFYDSAKCNGTVTVA